MKRLGSWLREKLRSRRGRVAVIVVLAIVVAVVVAALQAPGSPLRIDRERSAQGGEPDSDSELTATVAKRRDIQKLPAQTPRQLHLIKAGSAVFDARDLKGTVVKRERVEHEGRGPVVLSEDEDKDADADAGSDSDSGGTTSAPLPSTPAPAPTANFAGLDYNTWGAGHPPDTNGDVGPTYYIQTINTSIGIFNKSTGAQVAAFTFNTFMHQGSFGNLCDTDNFGDPVVLYDSFEDRWFISDFAFRLDGSGNVNPPHVFECMAVSKTGDPVNGGWNYYSIETPGGLGDYPKFGIWPDGIYMSANLFGYAASGGFIAPHVWALNKAQMYAGSPTVQVADFAGPSTDFSLLPANARLQAGTPPTGTPEYFVSTEDFLDGIDVYKFHVDWTNLAASTFTGPAFQRAPTCWPDADPTNVPTPANSLDPLSIRAMAEAQYSKIGSTESLWVDHTVDRPEVSLASCGATTSGSAAVRWYQLNVTGGTVAANMVQGKTWDPDGSNTFYRWMPSLAVDRLGDMAVGYSKANGTTNPQIKYAGRLAGDPINTFSQTEQTLIDGTGSQSGSCGGTCIRWGDYSGMSLDPNGCTFWMTNEYYATTGLNHQTRIGSFTFPGCTTVGNGNLTGQVTDGTNPIVGATVMLGSRTTTTDGSGNYSFIVPAGTYPLLTVSKPTFDSSSVTTIPVPDGGAVARLFVLTTSTTVAVSASTGTYGGTASLAATLTAGGSPLSGKTVNFVVNGVSVGSPVTNASGVATVSGASISGVNVGTYPTGVVASFAGGGGFGPSTNSGALTVTKADQTINVTTRAPATAVVNTGFTVAASTGAGVAVTFSSGGACTNSGANFTMTASSGTCTVKFDQAGNGNLNAAAEVTESVTAQAASGGGGSGGGGSGGGGSGGGATKKATTLTYNGGSKGTVGKKVTLGGHLRIKNGAVLSGKKVTMTLGSGKTAQTCKGTTNKSGNATCSVTVHQKTGSKPAVVKFAGDAKDLASTGHGKVTVKKP